MTSGVIKALSGNTGQHVFSPECCRGGNTVLWMALSQICKMRSRYGIHCWYGKRDSCTIL